MTHAQAITLMIADPWYLLRFRKRHFLFGHDAGIPNVREWTASADLSRSNERPFDVDHLTGCAAMERSLPIAPRQGVSIDVGHVPKGDDFW